MRREARSSARRSLLAAFALACAACARDAADRPESNVLLVTLGSVRADHLGCYGHGAGASPHLDELALGGVRFDLALSTAALAPQAHASILTGLNPFRHGLRVLQGAFGDRLPADAPTLARLLADHGWRCAAFVSSYAVSRAYGLDAGFEHFDARFDPQAAPAALDERRAARRTRTQRRADDTTDAALTWLEQYGEEGPWFSWVHYHDLCDEALVPPREFAAEHGVDYDGGASGPGDERRRLSDLELRYVDRELGRLVDWLRRSGQYERTLIVVVGDHGQEPASERVRGGWAGDGTLAQWSIQVPLVLRLPDDGPHPASVAGLVRTIDVVPTVLEALAQPLPAHLDGRSLLPILRGQMDEPRVAYAESLGASDARAPRDEAHPALEHDRFALLDRRWKLIYQRADGSLGVLYDLRLDPQESEDLYDQFPEQVARLGRFLSQHQPFDLSATSPIGPGPDLAALQELGY